MVCSIRCCPIDSLLRLCSIVTVAVLLGACATTVPDITPAPSYALAADPSTALGRKITPLLQQQPQNTGAFPLSDGLNAFFVRLGVMQAAEQSIDLQYYIYKSDEAGALIAWSALDAARRGVRVRILLDDLEGRADKVILALHRHPNIEIRLFNPFVWRDKRGFEFLGNFQRHNRRMHNKSLTVDNWVSIVGGRNIGNEYYAASEGKNFHDIDLAVIGPAVAAVSTQFDDYWNSPFAFPADTIIHKEIDQHAVSVLYQQLDNEAQALRERGADSAIEHHKIQERFYAEYQGLYWGKAKVLYDPPDKVALADTTDAAVLGQQLRDELLASKSSVMITSPYFVPGESGAELLSGLVDKGVDVRILTNSLASTDVAAVHSGYAKYRQPLLERGVEVFETRVDFDHRPGFWALSSKASLHSKAFIFDERKLFVGSFNFDPRSVLLNTEMGILIESEALSQRFINGFEAAKASCCYQLQLEDGDIVWRDELNQKTLTSEPNSSVWRRLGSWFMGWLPIEGLL